MKIDSNQNAMDAAKTYILPNNKFKRKPSIIAAPGMRFGMSPTKKSGKIVPKKDYNVLLEGIRMNSSPKSNDGLNQNFKIVDWQKIIK